MSTDAVDRSYRLNAFEQLRLGREILRAEGEALLALSQALQGEFCEAIDLLFGCRGSVIVVGMGKAGLVGQKIVATLASTGTPSHFLHPGEAVHGDLGRVQPGDVVLMLSFSGETEEVVRLLPAFAQAEIPLVAITGQSSSQLGQAARVVLCLGALTEACPLGLAPTTSTTAMMAIGDALALVLSRLRQFGREDFARYHPAGSLGRKLSKVEEVMRKLSECRVARQDKTVRQVVVDVSKPGRRTGAIMLVDEQNLLCGVFTDSDLARLLELGRERELDQPVRRVMTPSPKSIKQGSSLASAVQIITESRISELPVVDEQNRPVGLIDVTDIVGLLPGEFPEPELSSSPALSSWPTSSSWPTESRGDGASSWRIVNRNGETLHNED